jgi:hypothetical protein
MVRRLAPHDELAYFRLVQERGLRALSNQCRRGGQRRQGRKNCRSYEKRLHDNTSLMTNVTNNGQSRSVRRDRASPGTGSQVVSGAADGRETQSRERTACDPEVSDAERCGLRLIQVGRRSSPVPGRDEARLGRNGLESCCQENRAPIWRWRGSKVFLQGRPLNRVVTGIVATDAGGSAIVLVVTAVLGGHMGIAPSLAEQRGAGSGGKQQHDGQNGCAEHDQL